MNPLTNVKSLNKMNETEIKFGRVGSKTSWHNQYRESAWVFFAGVPYELTEGDIICVFSQYGEIVNINLIRDRKTGKSRGFGFLCYENQMSTDLAVDNFNGTKVIGRIIRVDHVNNYRPPKDHDDADEISKLLREKGCLNFDLNEIRNSNSSGESREKSGQVEHKKSSPPSGVRVKEENEDKKRERVRSQSSDSSGGDERRRNHRHHNKHKKRPSRSRSNERTAKKSTNRNSDNNSERREQRYDHRDRAYQRSERDRSRDRNNDRYRR